MGIQNKLKERKFLTFWYIFGFSLIMASNLCRPTLLKNVLQVSRSLGVASLHSTKMVANDEATHTGQTWAEDDLRQLRFMDREGRTKQTNTRWAIDLIAQVPPIMVDTRIVAVREIQILPLVIPRFTST